jgi:hypothetical protein
MKNTESIEFRLKKLLQVDKDNIHYLKFLIIIKIIVFSDPLGSLEIDKIL